MRNEIKTLAAAAALIIAAGFFPTPCLGEESRQATDGNPPIGPEERAAIWDSIQNVPPGEWRQRMEEWRNLTPEERRERIEQLRASVPPESADRLPEKPEKYIDRWQYHSALTMGGVSQFSLRNPWEEHTFWASPGEIRHEIEIVSHDPEQDVLEIRHGEETRELSLARSRVAEIPTGSAMGRYWRERMVEQGEQFRAFRERWIEIAEDAPMLRQVEADLREVGRELRETQQAMRDLEPGSDERQRLQLHQRELLEEVQLLTEIARLEMRNHPGFTEEDHRVARGIGRILTFVGSQ